MKIKSLLSALLLSSVVFCACQSKGNNSSDDAAIDSLSAVASEFLMPDVTLERTDGTSLQLSSLYGKTLFLDFWATWCPPCCAEIPHLEKLYEQLADNPDVRIISISVDQDRDAWTKKVAKDNPAWEQFRLSSENAEDFFRAIGLETIPRFIIVGPDGSIIDADAPRPSEETCGTCILQAIHESR